MVRGGEGVGEEELGEFALAEGDNRGLLKVSQLERGLYGILTLAPSW